MEKLMKEAKKAISAVFSNTSVGQNETRLNLEELKDEIDIMLDTLPDKYD
jgi:hypothetical protein